MDLDRRPPARTRSECQLRDAEDPLAQLRQRFALPPGVVYLDGNSLGALPVTAAAVVADVVSRQWGDGLVASWTDAAWIDAPVRLGALVAPLVGATADEVIVCDSTSVNLYKALAAGLGARPGRSTILTEHSNFPTDAYIADGLARVAGDGWQVRTVLRSQLEESLGEDVAVLMLTHVDYTTAYMHDMRRLSAAARAAGALTLWDLSHSTGAVPVDLGACGVDLAVGCGYKYLNGGPGAPAFMYVARHLQGSLQTPLQGWMGHAAPFGFIPAYEPAAGMRRFLAGTPPIIAMATLEAALQTWQNVDIAAVREKSILLTESFIALVDARCAEFGVEVVSPRAPRLRGSHVALRHPGAYALVQALRAAGVVGDFRPPDMMRFGFAPLYNSFTDAWDAVERLVSILGDGSWEDLKYARRLQVT